jgi:hypothetical protein
MSLIRRSNIDRLISKLGIQGDVDYEITKNEKGKPVFVLYRNLRPVAVVSDPTILRIKNTILKFNGSQGETDV